MFCIQCGTCLPEGSRFCLNCGMPMEPYAGVMASQNTMPDTNNISMPYIVYGSPQMGEEYRPPKGKFVLPIGFPVLFGILAFLAIVFFGGMIFLLKPQQVQYVAFAAPEWGSYVPLEWQEEILDCNLSEKVFLPEIPETEQAIEAREISRSYIIEDSNSRYLDYNELYVYTEEELYYAYFEIWARAGVDMSFDAELESYFSAKEWYYPIYSFDNILSEILNDYEIANMETIGRFMDAEIFGIEDETGIFWDDEYLGYDTGDSVSRFSNGNQSDSLGMW